MNPRHEDDGDESEARHEDDDELEARYKDNESEIKT